MLIKQAYLVVVLWIDFTQGRWLYVCSYFYIILHAAFIENKFIEIFTTHALLSQSWTEPV